MNPINLVQIGNILHVCRNLYSKAKPQKPHNLHKHTVIVHKFIKFGHVEVQCYGASQSALDLKQTHPSATTNCPICNSYEGACYDHDIMPLI